MKERPSWDKYFYTIAKVVATRSSCLKDQIGSVIVDEFDKRIISTGYNGPVRGAPHCEHCNRVNSTSGEGYDNCPSVHAELNAILSAARHGVSTVGKTMYLTRCPCYQCAKAIVNSGIQLVIFKFDDRSNPTIINYLDRNKVCVRFINREE